MIELGHMLGANPAFLGVNWPQVDLWKPRSLKNTFFWGSSGGYRPEQLEIPHKWRFHEVSSWRKSTINGRLAIATFDSWSPNFCSKLQFV